MNTRASVLPIVLLAPAALCHVVMVVKGVHFKAERIDFGLPPARSAKHFGDGIFDDREFDAWRPGTRYPRGFWLEGVPDPEEVREARLKRWPIEAARAEAKGRYRDALARYRALRDLVPENTNFVAGRIELLSTPGMSEQKGFRAYLDATRTGKLPPASLMRRAGPAIQAWVEFARLKRPEDYLRFADRYPRSTRVPAALITASRLLTLKPSGVADLAAARQAATRLQTEYPSSRFAWEAMGALARIDFLKGCYAAALAQYERQLTAAATVAQREEALQSIVACLRPGGKLDALAYAYLRWYDLSQSADPYIARRYFVQTLARFTAADATHLYGRLSRDPKTFSAYLDLRTQLEPNAPDGLARAPKLRRATAGTPYRGHVDGLLARTALALGRPEADAYARDALRSTNPDDQALGTFVLGTLDRRAGRLASARQRFASIPVRFPKSYLVGGARENLAIVAERLGDLQTALDQYIVLGYSEDVAYMTDARMSPAQLEVAIRRHGNDEAMRFTLAMRYLRREDWPNAERVLRGFSRAQRRRLAIDGLSDWRVEWDGAVQDPMATLTALRGLDQRIRRAPNEEAKAKAILAMADYYYRHRSLLLYSAPAWRGSRDYAITFSWNSTLETPEDVEALHRHYAEHECSAQALRRYRLVVQRFPKSSVAKLAAYRGAVAARRLAHMSTYWREFPRRDPLMATAVDLMAFAATSQDPKVAAKAKKYGKVFEEERVDDRQAFASERPPGPTWRPAW